MPLLGYIENQLRVHTVWIISDDRTGIRSSLRCSAVENNAGVRLLAANIISCWRAAMPEGEGDSLQLEITGCFVALRPAKEDVAFLGWHSGTDAGIPIFDPITIREFLNGRSMMAHEHAADHLTACCCRGG